MFPRIFKRILPSPVMRTPYYSRTGFFSNLHHRGYGTTNEDQHALVSTIAKAAKLDEHFNKNDPTLKYILEALCNLTVTQKADLYDIMGKLNPSHSHIDALTTALNHPSCLRLVSQSMERLLPENARYVEYEHFPISDGSKSEWRSFYREKLYVSADSFHNVVNTVLSVEASRPRQR